MRLSVALQQQAKKVNAVIYGDYLHYQVRED
jgi:predicted rRNA methylase YqxC with S4 and FtsJ domains